MRTLPLCRSRILSSVLASLLSFGAARADFGTIVFTSAGFGSGGETDQQQGDGHLHSHSENEFFGSFASCDADADRNRLQINANVAQGDHYDYGGAGEFVSWYDTLHFYAQGEELNEVRVVFRANLLGDISASEHDAFGNISLVLCVWQWTCGDLEAGEVGVYARDLEVVFRGDVFGGLPINLTLSSLANTGAPHTQYQVQAQSFIESVSVTDLDGNPIDGVTIVSDSGVDYQAGGGSP
jgi:hypothetical protein